jgi:DNA invertase Pin-like site-specific DNA recombinase
MAKSLQAINQPRVWGYCRISTDRQDTERQVLEIADYAKAKGLGDVTFVRETVSGKDDKPELERVISSLQQGDILAVWELSRLTRASVGALFTIAERIRKAGASLLEVKSGTTISSDVAGEAYIFALGLAARIERELISDRTKSALRVRKEKGIKLGRPAGKSKLDEKKDEIDYLIGLGLSKAKTAEKIGCSRSTLDKYLTTQRKCG